jgi:CRISPR-associated endoribonuclease Cas2 subtype I-E
MIVLCIKTPNQSLRGNLLRFMSEFGAGIFVGKLSKRFALKIWPIVCDKSKSAVLIFSANNEQGFEVFAHGDFDNRIVDNFGVTLVSRKNRTKKAGSKTGQPYSL